MCRNPNNENGNVDSGNDNNGSPFDIADCAATFGDKGYTVDDDLHQQLDLEDPKE